MIRWETIAGELFVVRVEGKREIVEPPADAKRALRDLIARQQEHAVDLQHAAEEADAAVRQAVVDDMDASAYRAKVAQVMAEIVASHDAIAAATGDLASIDAHIDRVAADSIRRLDAARIAGALACHPIPKEP